MRTIPELQLYGVASCMLQLLLTTILQLVGYFVVYQHDIRLIDTPITVWTVSITAAGLGVFAFVACRSWLLVIHCLYAVATTAIIVFVQQSHEGLMQDRCSRAQVSFQGCTSCVCSYSDTCTSSQLSEHSCRSCGAWGTDLCATIDRQQPVLIFLAAATALATSMPAVFSILIASRVESDWGSRANMLQFARNMVSRKLHQIEDGRTSNRSQPDMSRADSQTTHLIGALWAWGHERDKQLATKVARLLHIDTLAAQPSDATNNGAVSQTNTPRANASPLVPFVNPIYDSPSPIRTRPDLQGHHAANTGTDDSPMAGSWDASPFANSVPLPVEITRQPVEILPQTSQRRRTLLIPAAPVHPTISPSTERSPYIPLSTRTLEDLVFDAAGDFAVSAGYPSDDASPERRPHRSVQYSRALSGSRKGSQALSATRPPSRQSTGVRPSRPSSRSQTCTGAAVDADATSSSRPSGEDSTTQPSRPASAGPVGRPPRPRHLNSSFRSMQARAEEAWQSTSPGSRPQSRMSAEAPASLG